MDDDLDLGTAGGSARREGERRRANREARTRKRHPHIGGALLALREAPSHETVWATGAAGEEATASYLARHCPLALVLHDRRLPGRRANLDHITVAPSGVYVIDSKHYKGKKVRVSNPLFGSARLTVGGSDKTKLVEGLVAQVEAVSTVMAGIDDEVPVRGAFCFVEADLPLIGVPTIHDLPVLGRRGLANRINREGPLTEAAIRAIATRLAQALPCAA